MSVTQMIQRRVVDIHANLTDHLKLIAKDLCFFSLVIDESIDYQDTELISKLYCFSVISNLCNY